MTPIQALPRPGPRWGPYPQRLMGNGARLPQHRSALGWPGRLAAWIPASGCLHAHSGWLQQVDADTGHWQIRPAESTAWVEEVQALKYRLRREGFHPGTLSDALACVRVALERSHGLRLYPQQLLAAALMLDQRLVEMATGEGKTLTMGAAAAVAAMAGVPTHVVTANDYLAERDVQSLSSLWRTLGLNARHVSGAHDSEQRRLAYRADIVYSTAKDLAFDYLRDQLSGTGDHRTPPMLQGLSLALLDEADSILLDEAVVPLIISSARQEHPRQLAKRRAVWWQAWTLAQQLTLPDHATLASSAATIQINELGEATLAELCSHLKGIWHRPRLRKELVTLALTALHRLKRDEHYLLRDGRVELLDTLTGRIAQGRVLSQGLHALVELKEGLPPSPATDTQAQITFQRFFQRYWRLGGISGTLTEARNELQRVHGLSVVCMPPRHRSQRQIWPARHFASPMARWCAVAERVKELQGQGRPVLVGTDSVADSEALSDVLRQHGIPHVVLNARHDRQEATIVAQAGQSGAVTIATRMAGRGTDIALAPSAMQAGGLHIIACQRNESSRMDRQLLGRCARHGQPGSAETWICSSFSGESATRETSKLQRCSSGVNASSPRLPTLWHRWQARLAQWLEEQRQISIRRHLQDQDRQWEAQHRGARASGR
ncbi:MAG TPA: DEAD/DEAH box helicase [Aquabacterium sp.]|uniref:preprotein translocase subunit SecA n=1 Tax=Aquabacterium sp. TaxID=1872578 RepID=UPI002E30C053|nr:DEAD/DEAH box helicase [Aquabacterium sp.]HEX5373165.1 DEAD/DEAH box helicase [Aquabacterium sp.]